MKVVLRNLTCSFPSVFSPETFNGESTDKYAITLLIPEGDPQLKQLQAAMKEVGQEVLGSKWSKAKMSLRNGVENEYVPEGHWSLKCTSKRKPIVVDRAKEPLTADDDAIYGGAIVNVVGKVIAFESKYGGAFIQFQLAVVQKVADGERLGGDGETAGLDDLDSLDDDAGLSPAETFEPESDDAPF